MPHPQEVLMRQSSRVQRYGRIVSVCAFRSPLVNRTRHGAALSLWRTDFGPHLQHERPSVREPRLLAVQLSRAFIPPWLRSIVAERESLSRTCHARERHAYRNPRGVMRSSLQAACQFETSMIAGFLGHASALTVRFEGVALNC
jgi:hypothetical protein